MKIGKINEGKGITLIALVITIIVLLILAGVALRLVVGEDGITNRAVIAGKTQNIAGAKEQLELDIANYGGAIQDEQYNLVQTENDSKKWFVPSKSEWSAFGEELGITTSNYSGRGLSSWYWSSSQDSTLGAWYALPRWLHVPPLRVQQWRCSLECDFLILSKIKKAHQNVMSITFHV